MAESNVIRARTNIIEGFNKLNHAITRPSLDIEIIEGILDKYKFTSSFIIKRLYTYMYNFPWIITYFNKYMNYLGISSCSLVEFIRSFRYVLLCNGVLDSRRFYFMKMAAGKDDLQMKIIDLLDRYFLEQFNERFNYKELLFFYNLYLNGVIGNQEIYDIDLLMNNGSKTISLPDFSPENSEKKPISIDRLIKQYSESSRGVDFINNEVYKKKLETCEGCQYRGREIVPFDGNIKDVNDVDVLIVNLNPDLNDLREKRTFREKSIVRQNISMFPKNAKWLLINLVPCAFKGKSEIGKDFDEVREQLSLCNKVVLDVVKKHIKPKITILIGQEAASAFLPAAVFEETLGVLSEGQYVSVLHPISMRNAKAQIKGKKYWESVQKLVSGLEKESVPEEREIEPGHFVSCHLYD